MHSKDRRAFRAEFLAHAKRTKGWPVEQSVDIWCDETNRSFMQNGVYSLIARGEYSWSGHIELVVEFLLDPRHKNHVERRSLDEFLGRKGVPIAAQAAKETVLDLVSVVEEIPDLGFGLGARALHWFFDHEFLRMPGQFIRPVATEAQARDAAGSIYLDAGVQLAGRSLDSPEALRIVKARMGLNIDQYQDRVAKWWRRDPWTVVHATRQRGTGRAGVCITLPVTDSFLERATSGSCATYECGPDELRPESPNLILEGVASARDSTAKKGPGLSLLAAVVCQMAKLSDVPGLGHSADLRVVSFGGTPVGKKRLKWFGFRPLGTYFPGTKIEYFERRLAVRSSGFRDASLLGVWQGVQLHMRDLHGLPRAPGD